jgi:hypothetical protein
MLTTESNLYIFTFVAWDDKARQLAERDEAYIVPL